MQTQPLCTLDSQQAMWGAGKLAMAKPQAPLRVSSNDVLTAWFAGSSICKGLWMLVNARGRVEPASENPQQTNRSSCLHRTLKKTDITVTVCEYACNCIFWTQVQGVGETRAGNYLGLLQFFPISSASSPGREMVAAHFLVAFMPAGSSDNEDYAAGKEGRQSRVLSSCEQVVDDAERPADAVK